MNIFCFKMNIPMKMTEKSGKISKYYLYLFFYVLNYTMYNYVRRK